MKLNVTDRIVGFKNCFIVEVEWMHGDADTYTTEVHKYTDEKELIQHLEFLNAIKDMFKWGMGGTDAYFKKMSEADQKKYIDFEGTIPGDVTNYEKDAAYENHKVFWYDELGGKYNVEVTE
jgi:hypothetical protein